MQWTEGEIDQVELLLPYTLQLLESRPRGLTYLKVSRGTGLTVSWLNKLASGAIREPSVVKITRLWCYLMRNNHVE